LPDWPSVGAVKVPWMMFDDEPEVKLGIWREKFDLLQRIYEHRITPLVPQ
jgi:hypothetical protein